MRCCTGVLVLSLAFPALLAGQEMERVSTPDGYSYLLPNGWQPMPPEIIQFLRAQEDTLRARGAPFKKTEGYSAGLAGPKGGEWMSLPYILIRLDTTERVTRGALARMAGMAQPVGAATEALRDAGMAVRAEATEHLVWNEEAGALFSTFTLQRPDGVNVQGVQATAPWRRGLIMVVRYDPAGTVAPALIRGWLSGFVSAIEWPAHLAYDETSAATAERRREVGGFLGRIAGKGLVGALAGGAIMLFLGLFRRRPKESA